MALPDLIKTKFTPPLAHQFVRALDTPDGNATSEVRLANTLTNGSELPSKPYLAVPLHIGDPPQIERMLYLPHTKELKDKLIQSNNPLEVALEYVRQLEHSVIIGEWESSASNSFIFYEIKAVDLLKVYPLKK